MIWIQHVHKKFGSQRALDGLSLMVPEGKVFGLIGPNGAGKTTTIRILCGLIRPDQGSVEINGAGLEEPQKIRSMVGALIEQPGLYGKLTLLEYLTFFSRLHDLHRSQARKRIQELLELLELEDLVRERLQGFSLGMKQKVALARILLHDPPVLLLDEPTAGLDPLITKKVRDHILGPNDRTRKTVLVSTHNLDEASRVCDEIAIIRKGRIAAKGSWEALRRQLGGTGQVTVQLREADESYRAVLEEVEDLSDLRLDIEGRRLSYSSHEPAQTNPEVIARLVSRGAAIVSVQIGGATLEAAYLELTRETEPGQQEKGKSR